MRNNRRSRRFELMLAIDAAKYAVRRSDPSSDLAAIKAGMAVLSRRKKAVQRKWYGAILAAVYRELNRPWAVCSRCGREAPHEGGAVAISHSQECLQAEKKERS